MCIFNRGSIRGWADIQGKPLLFFGAGLCLDNMSDEFKGQGHMTSCDTLTSFDAFKHDKWKIMYIFANGLCLCASHN